MLKRRSNGSYFFRGEGIRATILPNGDVSFADRLVSDPDLHGEAPIPPPPGAFPSPQHHKKKSTVSAVATVKMSFDLTGPHSAERRWFLDRTRQFRDDLASKERQRKLADLEGVLQRIWTHGEVSFAQRRRGTIELWDSLSDDELGAKGRAVILRFIRTRCPRDSGCAFSEDELKALNQSGQRRALFAPYDPP